jgi:hypothetical protein
MNVKEHRGPIPEDRIQQFENRFGASLPEDYRAFLLQTNGGYPDPGGFAIRGTSDVSQVSRFLALDGERWDDIEVYQDRYDGRIPAGWLPIGYDDFGNLLLLGLEGANRGRVAFWDHELERDDPVDADTPLTRLSSSFSSFVVGLRE